MRKVCKKCKLFVDGQQCPICHNSNFSESWKGRIIVTDPSKSEIAKKIGIEVKGVYAIKVR